MAGPSVPGQQLSHPLLAAISAWRELEALSSEPGLTWVGSEGRAHLRSLGSTCQPQEDRQTNRQGQCGQRQKKEGHPGRDLHSSSPSYPRDVAHTVSIRNNEDYLPIWENSMEGRQEDRRGEHMGPGQAFRPWRLCSRPSSTPHLLLPFQALLCGPRSVPSPCDPLHSGKHGAMFQA